MESHKAEEYADYEERGEALMKWPNEWTYKVE